MNPTEERTPKTARVQTLRRHFLYAGLHGCESWCLLEIWEAPNQAPVVIVTNPIGNNGTSVTNYAAELATLVCRQFRLEPRALIWIECYERVGTEPSIRSFSPHTKRSEFDRVYFDVTAENMLTTPDWKPFGLAAAEALVGRPL